MTLSEGLPPHRQIPGLRRPPDPLTGPVDEEKASGSTIGLCQQLLRLSPQGVHLMVDPNRLHLIGHPWPRLWYPGPELGWTSADPSQFMSRGMEGDDSGIGIGNNPIIEGAWL